ncbi:hypothetical protein MMPV_004782 [Pyropia vietnamensis]
MVAFTGSGMGAPLPLRATPLWSPSARPLLGGWPPAGDGGSSRPLRVAVSRPVVPTAKAKSGKAGRARRRGGKGGGGDRKGVDPVRSRGDSGSAAAPSPTAASAATELPTILPPPQREAALGDAARGDGGGTSPLPSKSATTAGRGVVPNLPAPDDDAASSAGLAVSAAAPASIAPVEGADRPVAASAEAPPSGSVGESRIASYLRPQSSDTPPIDAGRGTAAAVPATAAGPGAGATAKPAVRPTGSRGQTPTSPSSPPPTVTATAANASEASFSASSSTAPDAQAADISTSAAAGDSVGESAATSEQPAVGLHSQSNGVPKTGTSPTVPRTAAVNGTKPADGVMPAENESSLLGASAASAPVAASSVIRTRTGRSSVGDVNMSPSSAPDAALAGTRMLEVKPLFARMMRAVLLPPTVAANVVLGLTAAAFGIRLPPPSAIPPRRPRSPSAASTRRGVVLGLGVTATTFVAGAAVGRRTGALPHTTTRYRDAADIPATAFHVVDGPASDFVLSAFVTDIMAGDMFRVRHTPLRLFGSRANDPRAFYARRALPRSDPASLPRDDDGTMPVVLAGVDCPAVGRYGLMGAALAEEARSAVADIFVTHGGGAPGGGGGRHATPRGGGAAVRLGLAARDDAGRLVATVWVGSVWDPVDVAAELLAAGLAVTTPGGGGGGLPEDAKARGVGVWRIGAWGETPAKRKARQRAGDARG